jgi:hypothetical protein
MAKFTEMQQDYIFSVTCIVKLFYCRPTIQIIILTDLLINKSSSSWIPANNSGFSKSFYSGFGCIPAAHILVIVQAITLLLEHRTQ